MSDDRPGDVPSPERPTAWKGLLREAFGPASVAPVADETTSRAPTLPASARFTAVDEIDRDATSVHARCRDLEMDREVSLRILEPEKDVAGFLERIQIGAQLQHPGIVPVYAFGLLEDGRAYVARRFVEGVTLAKLLDRETGSHRLLAVVEQAAHAVAFAHARGVAHGHLTAERILVGTHGEVLVTGWDRAVRASGDPASTTQDVRALLRLATGAAAGDPDSPLTALVRSGAAVRAVDIGRTIGAHLAEAESRARTAEVAAAEARATAEGEALRQVAEQRRAAREATRSRRTRVLAATILLAAAAGLAGAAWKLAGDRVDAARAESRVLSALRESERIVAAGDWPAARARTLEAMALAQNRFPDLHDRARDRHERLDRLAPVLDGRLVTRLERAFLSRLSGHGDRETVHLEMADVLREAGLDVEAGVPEEDAALIRRSRRSTDLVGLLDLWGQMLTGLPDSPPPDRSRILEVAGALDRDPWRAELRRAVTERSYGEILDLAHRADVARLPIHTLSLMRDAARHNGNLCGRFSVECRGRHPGSLMLSMQASLGAVDPQHRVRGMTSAVALRPDAAVLWVLLSDLLIHVGDAEGALAASRRAVSLDPSLHGAWCGLGEALMQTGRMERAIDAWRQAIRTPQPGCGVAHDGIAQALSHLGRHDEAKAMARELIEMDPAFGWVTLGQARIAAGDAAGGLDACRRAIEIGGTTLALPQAWFLLGYAYRMLGEPERARDALRTALLRARILTRFGGNPNGRERPLPPAFVVNVHVNLGAILCDLLRDYEGALREFSAALALDPENMHALVGLGNVHGWKGDDPAALAAYRRALDQDPDDVPALIGLGCVLGRKGDHSAALAALGRALDQDPGNVPALINLGNVLARKGDNSAALAASRRALAGDPENPWALSQVAMLLVGDSPPVDPDPEQAIELARKARERAPPELRACIEVVLGAAHYRAGRPAEAIRILTEVGSLDGEADAARGFYLAMAYASFGRIRETRYWLDRSVRLLKEQAPDDPQLGRLRTEAEALLRSSEQKGR